MHHVNTGQPLALARFNISVMVPSGYWCVLDMTV